MRFQAEEANRIRDHFLAIPAIKNFRRQQAPPARSPSVSRRRVKEGGHGTRGSCR
jgi:hypothetical protein